MSRSLSACVTTMRVTSRSNTVRKHDPAGLSQYGIVVKQYTINATGAQAGISSAVGPWSVTCESPKYSGQQHRRFACQSGKQRSARAGTRGRESRRRRRPASSCAKRWSTFAKASTARDRRSRRSRLDCRRLGAPECACRRRRARRLGRERKPSATLRRAAIRVARYRRSGRVPCSSRRSEKDVALRRRERLPSRLVRRRVADRRRNAPPRRGRPREPRVRLPGRPRRARRRGRAPATVDPG